MSLKRYSYSVDGTIPVPALLYDDEVLLSSQDGVGIYDGSAATPAHAWDISLKMMGFLTGLRNHHITRLVRFTSPPIGCST